MEVEGTEMLPTPAYSALFAVLGKIFLTADIPELFEDLEPI
jgi:hypothetical protein